MMDRNHATTLRRLRDWLMYLQQGYRIEKIEPTTILGQEHP